MIKNIGGKTKQLFWPIVIKCLVGFKVHKEKWLSALYQKEWSKHLLRKDGTLSNDQTKEELYKNYLF